MNCLLRTLGGRALGSAGGVGVSSSPGDVMAVPVMERGIGRWGARCVTDPSGSVEPITIFVMIRCVLAPVGVGGNNVSIGEGSGTGVSIRDFLARFSISLRLFDNVLFRVSNEGKRLDGGAGSYRFELSNA